ncbi:MAG: bifunctional diaminohydroxyphosphoribosylaminopyrimidine deaminase/5-amino-6-(5-phosphoribosylamino)uracil reductase RibD, partial [Campylobacteraceae bacterium]|nr:bifunctional diaminohydroxyphosphoribosylaminopyrimidine deaminase/5-amino-6-(5-phosphoribosylamino)uracil reductase RibD [Campylobacteraceae bacterium]
MKLALDAAWPYQGLTYPNPAVGCVVLDKYGALLSIEAHQKAGEAHAELRAVATALHRLNPKLSFPVSPEELHSFIIKNHQNLLKDSLVYVTLEPCNHQGSTPPCSKILEAVGIKRLCVGALEENQKASGGAKYLKDAGMDVKTKIMEKECNLLIAPFRAWQDGHFSFAKLAMTNNGTMDGGIISGISSRIHLHALRNVITMLAIGGNTVRKDKPKLDARLVNGRAPNVFIYS